MWSHLNIPNLTFDLIAPEGDWDWTEEAFLLDIHEE